MKKSAKSKVFFSSKISYYLTNAMAIFLIATIVILSLSTVIYTNVKDHTEEMYYTELKNGMKSLSVQLMSLSSMLMTCNSNDIVDFCFLKSPLKPADVIDMIEMKDYVVGLSSANALLLDLVIYFPRSDVVVSRYALYSSLEQYKATNTFSNDVWLNRVKEIKSLSGFITCPGMLINDLQHGPMDIAFVLGVPFAVNTTWCVTDVYAWLLMDARQLSALFGSVYDACYCFTIVGRDGEMLFSLGNDCESSGKKFAVMDTNTGLTVSVRICFQELLTSILWALGAYILLMILACFGATVFFAIRAAKPMNEIADQLLPLGLSNDHKTLDFIKESIEQLGSSYYESLDTIKHLQAQQLDYAIDRCLFSQIQHEVPELPSSYIVVYVVATVSEEEKGNILTLLIGKHLVSVLASSVISHSLDECSFLLIVPVISNDDVLISKLTASVEKIKVMLNANLQYGLSNMYSGSTRLRLAFDEARANLSAKQGMCIGRMMETSADLNFDMLQRFYHSMLERNQADAEIMLSACLYARTPLDMGHRYSTVRMIIVCAYWRMYPDDDALQFETEYLGSFHPYLPIEQLYSEMRQAVHVLCARDPPEDSETSRFIECVFYGYTDSNFSIQSIMNELQANEKSVYDICKRATGKSPAAYIQQVRLENASSLLRNTAMSIREVCEQSGYNTLSTFYKAFKRVYGVTPTQYRRTFIDFIK